MNRLYPFARFILGIVIGLFVMALVASVMGCATQQAPLVTEVRTVDKPVPVVSKCLKESDIPAVPRTNFIKGGNIESNAAAASADLRDLAQYADKADAVLRQCASP